jgi:NifU-like protein involved in Fe-S cluster formation
MKDELYHQAILDLAKRAREASRLDGPDASVTVDNPLCGDRVTVDLTFADGRVRAVGHKVRGCLLCQAAAAAIAARAPGETPARLREIAGALPGALAQTPETIGEFWSELAAFTPVHAYKSRYDCVLLPFAALTRALDQIAAGPRAAEGQR